MRVNFQKQEVRGPDITKVFSNYFMIFQCVLISPKQEVRGHDIVKVLFNHFKKFWCVLISPKQEVRGPDIAKVLFNRFSIHALTFGFFLQRGIQQTRLLDPQELAS